MSNAMTLFGNSTAVSPLLAGIEDSLTDTLAGGSLGTNRRISIEGGVWREMVNGKEVRKSEERSLNAVIVNAAPISRTYYGKGVYVKGQKTKPVCWSSDTQKPDDAVPEDQRQAEKCRDCPQHIKGSGQGDSRACRFQQRIAVMLDGAMEKQEVYQIALPAKSIFGDAENGKFPLQAYARHLKAHNTHAIAIMTEMRFDTDEATPKIVFKPVRMLTEAELKLAIEMRDHPDTVKAITFTVSQMDGAPAPEPADLFSNYRSEDSKPEAAPAPASTLPKVPKKAEAESAEPPAEDVEEPKKTPKKAAPADTPKADLKGIVDDWDD